MISQNLWIKITLALKKALTIIYDNITTWSETKFQTNCQILKLKNSCLRNNVKTPFLMKGLFK
jgi:hypothetical protein